MRTLRLATILGSTPVWMTRLITVVAAVGLAACTLDKQTAPPLAGPSELGMSIAVTATPDIITQDGQSHATIEAVARDAAGQPVSGVTLRVETLVNGTTVDLGTLASKIISTGGDGRAVTTYQSPSAPPPTQSEDTIVSIQVTPVGTNYAGAVGRRVDVRLARPGVIVAPGSDPTASFFVSPSAPREEDDVYFDASSSRGDIVSYTWNFGDGRVETTSEPTTRHHYSLAGTYTIVLTVTDQLGRKASSAPAQVTVGSVAPTAVVTASPTDPLPNAVVAFNGSGSTAPTGRSIVEYLWDLGDGTAPFVGGPAVAHKYPVAGTYTVVLRVTDSAGRTAVATVVITVAVPAP